MLPESDNGILLSIVQEQALNQRRISRREGKDIGGITTPEPVADVM